MYLFLEDEYKLFEKRHEIYFQIIPPRTRKTASKYSKILLILNLDGIHMSTHFTILSFLLLLLYEIFHNKIWKKGRLNQKSQAFYMIANLYHKDKISRIFFSCIFSLKTASEKTVSVLL